MDPTTPAPPSTPDQPTFWNEIGGPRWVRFQERLDAQIRVFGQSLMERLAIAPDERVLDIGCGCGDTTLEIARAQGSRGSVVGVDVSSVMLDRARLRLAAEPGLRATFVHANVETDPLPDGPFDVAYSRFGVMFFHDPVAAFRRIRSTLRPGGRLGFVCWQGLEDNPWLRIPMEAARSLVTFPAPSAPNAPGPMAFADPARARQVLADAGFDTIELQPCPHEVSLGGDGSLEGAVEIAMEMGPLAAALRQSPGADRAAASDAVRAALAQHSTARGVWLPALAWIVTARGSV